MAEIISNNLQSGGGVEPLNGIPQPIADIPGVIGTPIILGRGYSFHNISFFPSDWNTVYAGYENTYIHNFTLTSITSAVNPHTILNCAVEVPQYHLLKGMGVESIWIENNNGKPRVILIGNKPTNSFNLRIMIYN